MQAVPWWQYLHFLVNSAQENAGRRFTPSGLFTPVYPNTCFLAIQVNFSLDVEQKALTATYNCFHTSKFRHVKLWTNRNLLRNLEETSFMSSAHCWQLQITNSINQTK